jgi:hypothetical protein
VIFGIHTVDAVSLSRRSVNSGRIALCPYRRRCASDPEGDEKSRGFFPDAAGRTVTAPELRDERAVAFDPEFLQGTPLAPITWPDALAPARTPNPETPSKYSFNFMESFLLSRPQPEPSGNVGIPNAPGPEANASTCRSSGEPLLIDT